MISYTAVYRKSTDCNRHSPPKESSLKKLIVIASTEVVDKLRRLRIDMAHCRCTIKLKKAVKIGNRRVHQHYQHYCVVPLRKELLE